MDTDKYRGLKAISYSRASLGKKAGRQLDSTDRQKDEALLYAERLGMDLDLDYRIVDEGVSAFKLTTTTDEYGRKRQIAKNLEEGALADFVEVVKKGRFPNGVNLIIEKLDRLYRDKPRRALGHFIDLLEHDVTIHTLIDNKIYDPNSNNDAIDLMMSIMYLVASHQYSKDLSARIKLSYKRRIEKMMESETLVLNTGRINDWVQIKLDPQTQDKIFFVSDYSKKLIQEMFHMYSQNLSDGQIATKLNKRGTRDFNGNAWTNHRVRLVLTSRAVIGKYTPKKGSEIQRESLRIISDAEFHEIQEIRKAKVAKGRKSPDIHIFSGLTTCGYCLSKEKNKRGTPYKHSTITYIPSSLYSNRAHMPMEVSPPHRRYFCQSGRIDSRNCHCDTINYYHFHDSFFSFIRDLDFSTLLNTETKLDHKFLDGKISGVKAEMAELDIQVNDEIRLNRLVRNESARKKIADRIDELTDERDQKAQELEELKLQKANKQNVKQDFIDSEASIKELIDKAYNDHYWYALRTKMVSYYSVPEGGLTKEQLAEKKDINRLWDIHLLIVDAEKKIRDAFDPKDAKKAVKHKLNLEKEEMALIKKYFKDEYEKDQKALEFKNALNGQLRRFIKEIKIYPYGFSAYEASKPYTDRDEKESTYDKHFKELKEADDESKIQEIELAEPKNKEKGWEKKEIPKVLGIPSTTYRRYIDNGTLKDFSYTKKKLTPVWKDFLKKSASIKSGSIKRSYKAMYSKYFSYSIEFTDICKPDIIKYVIPFDEDRTQGISFDQNIKKMTWDWSGYFGKKEIKLLRNKSKSSEKEDIFYVEDYPVFAKALKMAKDAGTRAFGNNEGFRELNELAETLSTDPADYTFTKYKKLNDVEDKLRFLMGVVQNPKIDLEKQKVLYSQIYELGDEEVNVHLKKVVKNFEEAYNSIQKH